MVCAFQRMWSLYFNYIRLKLSVKFKFRFSVILLSLFLFFGVWSGFWTFRFLHPSPLSQGGRLHRFQYRSGRTAPQSSVGGRESPLVDHTRNYISFIKSTRQWSDRSRFAFVIAIFQKGVHSDSLFFPNSRGSEKGVKK